MVLPSFDPAISSEVRDVIRTIHTAVQSAPPFEFGDEAELHRQLQAVFVGAGIDSRHEVQLSHDARIDFLVDSHVGIEVKAARQSMNLVRQQLRRYPKYYRLRALVLLTTVPDHEMFATESFDCPLFVIRVPVVQTQPDVNWSIRLTEDEADTWGDLQHALRRETGRRTLTKAALFRGLLDLLDSPAARRELVDILTAIED
ncbi:hypothetical protein AB0M12_41690 [Nocardia vinacea]|uniref:hypothetical protein n=1 Tax=Nocardia vinacea TaxID=96468 RepID=UPI00343CA524